MQEMVPDEQVWKHTGVQFLLSGIFSFQATMLFLGRQPPMEA